MPNIAAKRIKRSRSALFIASIYCFFLLILLSSCKPKISSAVKNSPSQELFRLYAKQISDSFEISVQLPLEYEENSDKKYPVVLLTDANFFYPMLAPILHQYEKGGLLPPLILIGIGYRSFEAMDSLRIRDYLYPEALVSDEMEAMGGGKNFFHFITRELVPRVDSSYRTNGIRTLLGHSFGGYFSLYALLEQLNQQQHYFNSFIAASPTLWYHDHYLFQLPNKLSDTRLQDSLSLFLSVGGLEEPTWSIQPVKRFAKNFADHPIAHFKTKYLFYEPLDHMDVGLISFIQGLEMIYSKQDEPSK